MYQVKNGPFVHAIGYVTRPDFTVHCAAITDSRVTTPIAIADDGTVSTVSPQSPEQMLEALPRDVLKASGVARARNSARSTIFAALVAQEFNRQLADKPGYNPDRVVIGIANCSASASISWEYETEGVTMGWRNTNTMLMPSALPSAIGTQISSAIKTHNATITFLNDILGMCSALEYTHVNFFHDRADYAFVIAGEELSVPHQMVKTEKAQSFLVDCDGASGLLLTRERLQDEAWQLVLLQHSADADAMLVPDDWRDAPVLRLTIPEHRSAFSTLVLPFAVHKICSNTAAGRGILIVSVENRSSYALGFQLTAK